MPTLPQAIEALRAGKMVILVDDEDRENEGDLVMAAEFATAEAVNFMARFGRGLICMPMEASRIDALKLPPMAARNGSPRQTAFTVSIEARSGITTGISAHDRARTIQVAADPTLGASELSSPGHVFPLRAVEGGVLVRAGHTEGSIDLVKMAGLKPSAVICEVMKDDGTMARLADLKIFAAEHDLPIISIRDVIAARMQNESLIKEIAKTKFPSAFSSNGEFELHAFESLIDQTEHLALVKGPLTNPALVRVHSECLTGDALGSLRCDCGSQLQSALAQIAASDNGVLVYMRRHEGRGIGLGNKIRAYALQDTGMDTVEANRHLGFQADLRHYGLGAQILKYLGVTKIKLLTNNPKKIIGLDGYGLEVIERVPIEMPANQWNLTYLTAKRDKLGHELGLAGSPSPASQGSAPSARSKDKK
jgi:3,4-dihydroxy 2-butanone 4-phosphate synthase/GTP cyclohydrolase II